MNVKKLWIMAVIIGIAMMAVLYLNPSHNTHSISLEKPLVSVSTFSLYEVAQAVGDNHIELNLIIPLGSDAHMFSPNPQQVATLAQSDVFVYSGAGFEAWAEGTKNILPSTTDVVDMSRHVHLIRSDKGHHDGDEHHEGGAYDPHYWLDIDNMIQMTQKMEQVLSLLLPEQKKRFTANAQSYRAQLKHLKSEYETGLKECKNRTLVSNHDAFGYLAHSNHLKNVSIIGFSSDEQPDAKTVAKVTKVLKEHSIKTIFFEELINDNIAQTLAKETGARAQSLQPLENISQDELQSHQTYLSIMRENLKKLREAMECR